MKLTRLRQIIAEEARSLIEGKSAKALRAEYDKALKKEQALSSLLLVNLEKYKAAKAKGDEKAIAKHTKIAGDIGKKKKKASTDASAAPSLRAAANRFAVGGWWSGSGQGRKRREPVRAGRRPSLGSAGPRRCRS